MSADQRDLRSTSARARRAVAGLAIYALQNRLGGQEAAEHAAAAFDSLEALETEMECRGAASGGTAR